MRPVLAVPVVVLALLAPDALACPAGERLDPFTLFDRAVTVVEARVATPDPPPGSGRKAMPIELAVDRIYKGDAKLTSIVTRDDGSSCAPEFRANRRAIYFLDDKRDVIGGYQGYLEVDDEAWDTALSAWRDATSDDERAEVLVRGTEVAVTASAAADRLLDEVALYPKLGARRRARLVRAVADDRQPSLLLLVLARLRVTELPALLDTKAWAYEDAVRGMLARTAIATVRDRAALAAVVGDRRRPTLDRVAALEACERLRGQRLESFVRYLHPDEVDWRTLAAACRR